MVKNHIFFRKEAINKSVTVAQWEHLALFVRKF